MTASGCSLHCLHPEHHPHPFEGCKCGFCWFLSFVLSFFPISPKPGPSVCRVQRLKAQELLDVQAELEKSSKELATTSEYLAGVMAELAVAQVGGSWLGG